MGTRQRVETQSVEVLLLQAQKVVLARPVKGSALPLLAALEPRQLWLELELFALHSLQAFSSASQCEHLLA